MKVWDKYKLNKEISSKENIKTYKAIFEPIIKEITPRNNNEYDDILYYLKNYKDIIYEIIEENNKIYVVLLNDNIDLDNIILNNINLDNINKIKEVYIGNISPITKNEIDELFKKEKAMCKIITDNIENNSKNYGTGFFVKLNGNHCGLLTNNHIINNIQVGDTIHLEYSIEKDKHKKIEITNDRKVYTNEELDYTFIEILKEDNIQDYFKIYSKNINDLINHSIYILQYPNNNELSFSYGEIQSIKNNEIKYNASTTVGSSGSPLILRTNDNLVIGIHHSGVFPNGRKSAFNLGTTLNSIITDIEQKNCLNINKNNIIEENQNSNNLLNSLNKDDKNKELYEDKNEINCVYNKKDKEPIILLHDFKLNVNNWSNENKILYEEGKKNINVNNIEIYINNKKIKFNYKYESNEIGQIRIKLKFNKLLTSTAYMFYGCSSLKTIDLSSFKANNVINMSGMFNRCSSLESIDLSKFNTNNVTDMSYMFYHCFSLKSIDLSSLNTFNVINMNCMFYNCFSLKSIDLSKFNANNATDMRYMFYNCSSLKSIDLSSFNENNITNLCSMFNRCSSLESIDLSNFNTNNVTDMSYMFNECYSLKSINLSSFNTNNVNDMSYMFNECYSLELIDLSSFNTNNVNDMSYMFNECSSLTNINLSNFNTNNVNDMGRMFFECKKLKKNNIITKDKRILNECDY